MRRFDAWETYFEFILKRSTQLKSQVTKAISTNNVYKRIYLKKTMFKVKR